MCGRFTLTADLKKIAERFGVGRGATDLDTAAESAGDSRRYTPPVEGAKRAAEEI